MANGDFILETRSLTKHFSGFVAVDNVNLRIRRGTIHALIGPNGAGKTTVFNLLTKFIRPSNGQIFFKGRDVTHDDAAIIARSGIARSVQISAVFPRMSVLENVQVTLHRNLGFSSQFWKSSKVLQRTNARARELLDAVDLSSFAEQTAVNLPYG